MAQLDDLHRRLAKMPLGPIMATAFAAALAFALYAMPNWLLTRAVVASRLPDLLSAAEPPLGATARGLVMLAAAALGGGAVWALFRWIDRPRAATTPDEAAAPATAEPQAPTLRRADAHPDAPARRPIFAAEDLGAPFDEAPPVPWRGEARRLQAVVPVSATVANDAELLLDARFATIEPAPLAAVPPVPDAEPAAVADVAPVAEAEPLPDSAAALLARLEAGLARRSAVPRPDSRLREGLARVANG